MRKDFMVFLLIVNLFSGLIAEGQVKIRKILSPTKINQYNEAHLVMIDFWATWCAPCINIGKQLESTQEIFRDNLTIISLTKESEPVVQKFIDTHHPRLTIALDDENQTFDFYGVNRTLPWSVLLDQRGQILWKGNPADLTIEMIESFIQENKNHNGRRSSKFISIAVEKPVLPKPAGRDWFSVQRTSAEDNYFYITEEGVEFQGKSSRLFSEILKRSRHDIRVENDPVIQVKISILNWNIGAESVLDRIVGELGMTRQVITEETDYYRLSVKNHQLLWDDKQISLGNFDGACLMGDESISVDNAPVEEFAFRLSEVMDYPVYTDYDSPARHDWIVHYKYFDLTKEQLINEFGIRIEKKRGKHEVCCFR